MLHPLSVFHCPRTSSAAFPLQVPKCLCACCSHTLLPPIACAGADDVSVLACCGTAPCGRLASIRQAVALEPYLSDGPEVPVSLSVDV